MCHYAACDIFYCYAECKCAKCRIFYCYAECHYAKCHIFTVIANDIMLSVDMLNDVIPSVAFFTVTANVIMLSVVVLNVDVIMPNVACLLLW